MTKLIIQGPSLTAPAAREIAASLKGTLEYRADHARIVSDQLIDQEALAALRTRFPLDINAVPAEFNPAAARLFISDMDSTLINIECLDEIADFIGIRPQVAAITEAAMRGEIDFESSLRRRIALLKGLDSAVLQQVYRDRLRLNAGAEQLIEGLRARGISTALVSGGFTFFTERLRKRLGLDYALANELDIEAGMITGHVRGAIVGAAAKAEFLFSLCDKLGIDPRRAVAVGDGANDLPMLSAAGLGVAFRAKPAVQKAADVVLNHAGLDGILAFLEQS